MNAEKYLEILETHLFHDYPFLENSAMEIEDEEDQFPAHCFIQDNAPAHTAKIIGKFFEENLVNVLKWPSNSPDLNIMENVWSYVKDVLYQIRDELTCAGDTWVRANEIWNNIPMTYIQDLYNDLPIRMKELKDMKGGPLNH